jgi:hypothetical protein
MKNKKWLAAAAIMLLAAVSLSFYWRDEELTAQTIALSQPPIINIQENENAYFAYMGLAAEKEKNSFEAGKTWVARHESLLHANPPASLKQLQTLAEQPFLKFEADSRQLPRAICRVQTESCVKKFGLAADQIKIIETTNSALIERYEALLLYPSFADLSTPSNYLTPAFAVSQSLTELAGAKASIALASNDINGAFNILEANIQFWHKNLRGSNTLLARMVATANLRTLYAFLNDFLDFNPALAKSYYDRTQKILANFTSVDTDFTNTLRGEYRFGENLMNRTGVEAKELLTEAPSMVEKLALFLTQTPLYRPNATLNRHAAIFSRYLTLAKLPAYQLIEKKPVMLESLENDFGSGKHLIRDLSYNPLGNAMNSMGLMAFWEHPIVAHDLDAYVRLLKLKLEIRHHGIAPADVPRFIAAYNATLFNPFTNQPMSWDEVGQSIYFNKIHGSEEEKKVRIAI